MREGSAPGPQPQSLTQSQFQLFWNGESYVAGCSKVCILLHFHLVADADLACALTALSVSGIALARSCALITGKHVTRALYDRKKAGHLQCFHHVKGDETSAFAAGRGREIAACFNCTGNRGTPTAASCSRSFHRGPRFGHCVDLFMVTSVVAGARASALHGCVPLFRGARWHGWRRQGSILSSRRIRCIGYCLAESNDGEEIWVLSCRTPWATLMSFCDAEQGCSRHR
jgi:hypothetical protein